LLLLTRLTGVVEAGTLAAGLDFSAGFVAGATDDGGVSSSSYTYS
jgi:hypothetical protein